MNPVFEGIKVFEAFQAAIQAGRCCQRRQRPRAGHLPSQLPSQLPMAGWVLLGWIGCGLGASGAMAQPGTVMAIPVPAPLSGSHGGGGQEVAPPVSGAGNGEPGRVASQAGAGLAPAMDWWLRGEALAMPDETVPLGHWQGRSGVKTIALGEMPWMDGGMDGAIAMQGFPVQGFPVQSFPVQGFLAQGFLAQGFPVQGAPLPYAAAQYRVVVATPSPRHVQVLKQVMPGAMVVQDGQAMQAGAFADWNRANVLQRALANYGFAVQIQGL